MTDSKPGLNAQALRDRVEDAMWWELEPRLDAPVVAVAMTPHGSYTFAVDAADWDGQRIVLWLREIDQEAS